MYGESRHFDRGQKKEAARKGAAALWQRYRTDHEFKKALDQKLQAPRSRGGAKSLASLSEAGFKNRLATSAKTRQWPTYRDSHGNLLRSKLELRVAEALLRDSLPYEVEPRILVPGHVFYPDFHPMGSNALIEAVGYAADWYWDKTAQKIRLIVESYPEIYVAVVTRFHKQMKRRLHGMPNVAIFTPYELDRLTRWCRGCRGSQEIVPEGRVVNARATRAVKNGSATRDRRPASP